MNSSSVSVSWDSAIGEFDFHRVTVANNSVTTTFTIPKEERVAVVTGLVDGCSYNVSAERVRGLKAGSAASLTVTTGRWYYKGCARTSLSCWNFLHTSDSISPFLVAHQCQPLYEECAWWTCLHVHSCCVGSRRLGVWIITRWTCNQIKEKSQCSLHMVDTSRYTHMLNETHCLDAVTRAWICTFFTL